jgi:hypothetical protein
MTEHIATIAIASPDRLTLPDATMFSLLEM